jgi:pre-mRNA 3'-end-processing factor FIP1
MARGGPPPGQVLPQAADAAMAATSGPPQANGALVNPIDQLEPDDGVDTSTLPPATAPPGGPTVDASAVGVFNGQSILEVDLSALADKPWRRPGSDLSDWFNYGFDELSWEAYCHLRRDIGDLATTLKANVIVSGS